MIEEGITQRGAETHRTFGTRAQREERKRQSPVSGVCFNCFVNLFNVFLHKKNIAVNLQKQKPICDRLWRTRPLVLRGLFFIGFHTLYMAQTGCPSTQT